MVAGETVISPLGYDQQQPQAANGSIIGLGHDLHLSWPTITHSHVSTIAHHHPESPVDHCDRREWA
jgi:hypothetical protein